MPAPDPANGNASATAEVTSLAGRQVTEMIAAFRAMFLGSPETPYAGRWANPVLRGLGLMQVPETLIDRRDVETLFAFARSERFLAAQAEESRRSLTGTDRADPVRTLDQALGFARERDLWPDMAAFTLARARWGRTMAAWTPLAALRAGRQSLACELADAKPEDQQAFWYLLMAWELFDAGSRDAARMLLSRLLPKKLPLLGAETGHHIVALLRYAAEISPEAVEDLQQRLLDDNDRTDLCRELTAAGQFALVPAVAAAIRLSIANRIPVLAGAAKAAIAAGQPELAATAIAGAADAVRLIEADGGDADGAGLAENLALVAGVQAAHGDLDAGAQTFDRATAACARAQASYQVAPALRTIAAEQAAAGLFGEAERTIARITDSHYEGEALAALAVARAVAGQADDAVRTLDAIEPGLYLDYPGAACRVACALAGAGRPDLAGEVARQWLRIEQHAGPIATVAVAIARAGESGQAMTLADGITEPGLRARLLAKLATGSEQDRGPLLAEALRLAGTLTDKNRWHTLLAVAVAQLTADPAGAQDTFGEIRQIIRETEIDSSFWTDELWRVGMTRADVGDTAGARQTFAEILEGPAEDQGHWLKPVTLAGIALGQAEAGQTEAARRGCGLAIRHAAGIRGQWQPVVWHAIATAQAAAGDLDAAAETMDTMLELADTDDDDTAAVAVEQGVLAAVRVARELARAGRRKKARRLLTETAKVMRARLEHSAFSNVDETSELACALAELGKDGKAAKVAGWDITGTAAGRMHAVAAGRQAADGDLDGALATARVIQHPLVIAEAFGVIASALTGQGSQAQAHAVLTAAAGQLRAAEPAILAVPALTKIAAAQAAAGCPEDIAATLGLARLAASDLDRADDRDQALSQIAQSWALHGDPGRALELAADIGHEDRAGEALVTAALAIVARSRAGSRSGSRAGWPEAATAIIDGVTSPGWQAIGLAVAGAATARGGDTDPHRYVADVEGLITQLPEGEPRARARRYVIEVMLASGDYQVALALARAVTARRGLVLSELAGELAARGAADAVKDLLPDCAREPESAYAACLALARAVPSQAEAIAGAIAQPRGTATIPSEA